MNFSRDSKLQQVEFVEGCRHIGYPTRQSNPSDQKRRKKLFFMLDPDKSGALDFKEFVRAFGETNLPHKDPRQRLAEDMRRRTSAIRRGFAAAAQAGVHPMKEDPAVKRTALQVRTSRFLPRTPELRNNGIDPPPVPPMGNSDFNESELDASWHTLDNTPRVATAPPGPRPLKQGEAQSVAQAHRGKRLEGCWLGALSRPLPPDSSVTGKSVEETGGEAPGKQGDSSVVTSNAAAQRPGDGSASARTRSSASESGRK